MVTKPKTLAVNAIKNGTVIDHIYAGEALKIVLLLCLNKHPKIVTLGLNLPSKTLEAKDIIKIEDRELNPQEANQVALLAPKATINIIKEYEVIKKFPVQIPDLINSQFSCPNPKCISNHEKIATVFYVKQRQQHRVLQCKFCRKVFTQHEINTI